MPMLSKTTKTVKDLQKYPHAQQGILDPTLDGYKVFVLTNYRGMPIYSSEVVYEADDGSVVNYVPANTCLVASTAIQHKMAYAGVAQVDPETKIMYVWEGTRVIAPDVQHRIVAIGYKDPEHITGQVDELAANGRFFSLDHFAQHDKAAVSSSTRVALLQQAHYQRSPGGDHTNARAGESLKLPSQLTRNSISRDCDE